jgi:hemolysin activation/secretion protein
MKTKLFTLTLLALAQSALYAQPLGAGSPMQQIPPIPAQQKAFPEVRIEHSNAPTVPVVEGVAIQVKQLHVIGQTLFSEGDLIAVTGFQPGSNLSLTDLRAMASRIAAFYNSQGYFVAQAYLPAQDIKDGVVTIAVIEGRYGKITLRNQTNLSDGLANGLLDGLDSGDPVASAPLEERLLLLSDIPGVEVKSTLTPGAEVGTSDLLVDVTPGKRVSGLVEADNEGNRYTGEYRLGATVNLNNPTGHGDVASLRGLTSGKGLNYVRGSYQMQFGRATAGVAYAAMRYELGEEFEYLKANGTVQIASIYGSYPLIRSRNNNLYARVNFDDKTFQDKVDSTSSVTDKKAQVLTAGLDGDHRDSLGGGGWSAYSLALSTGRLDIQTPVALVADNMSAQSNGNFNKLAFSAMRLQNLSGPFSLYGSIKGQVASKNLDTSEKMELGGAYAVRAYPEGEAYADQGYVVNLEARMALPKFSQSMAGQMQAFVFADTGSVTINKNPWMTGPNTRTLSGAGVGLTWADDNNFMVKVSYARKLGDEPATSAPDASGRFWIHAVKYF